MRVQAGYLALPITEAPETQIYFINHRSGAFLVLRLRTVVRGERASRSIVNRTTALWSIWVVASLILAGSGLSPFLDKRRGAKSQFRAALTEYRLGRVAHFGHVVVRLRRDDAVRRRRALEVRRGGGEEPAVVGGCSAVVDGF